MATRTTMLAMMAMGALMAAAGDARAEADGAGSVVVPLVGRGGRPAYCAANHSGGRATPQVDGGYRVGRLAPGHHVIRLELTDERVDVIVVVGAGLDGAGEEVVVPPVIVRGVCRDVTVGEAAIDLEPTAALPAWALRIGRRYQAQAGVAPAAFVRDHSLMRERASRFGRRGGGTRDL